MSFQLQAGPNWRVFLAAGLLAVVVGPWLPAAVQEAIYAVLAGATCAAAITRFRREPARRFTWGLLAAGMAVGALCNAAWSIGMVIAGPFTGLSVVDGAYFTMYVLVAAAAFVSAGRPGAALAGAAEAWSVACTGLILVWFFLYDPLINDRQGWDAADAALAYPLLDLLLVAAAVRLLVLVGRPAVPHLLMLAGYGAMTAADTVYFLSLHSGGAWSGPGVSVAGWTLFFATIGAATMHPGTGPAAVSRPTTRNHLGLLYAVLVVVNPAVTAWALFKDLREGEFDSLDIVLPLIASALVAVLLVGRLSYAQNRTTHLASHDQLTGLPNRFALEREVAQALTRSLPGSLLVLDLDEFREVNDAFGHPTGDALLPVVAARLTAAAGPSSLVARLGGDEFAVLVADLDEPAAAEFAGNLGRALRQPFDVNEHRLHVTASIGLRQLAGVPDASAALGDADLALYAAKAAGKDRVVPYKAAMRDEQQRRLALMERLRAALGTGEFAVHYQPIVHLQAGRFDAVEALIRWNPVDGDPITPDMFIPAAEDSGLIVPLGAWILHQACRDAVAWHRQHGVGVSVNVSPRQLREPDFADTVRRALLDTGLPSTALILEITEGVLVNSGSADNGITQLADLRADGVRIAVDDFGTGYSSLAYLRDLPIDILKIDRSFLPVDPDPGLEAMVRTIVDLGHSLGLTCVAEGVETAEQADMLRGLRCDKGQGWHFGRPTPADRTSEVLAAGVRTTATVTTALPG